MGLSAAALAKRRAYNREYARQHRDQINRQSRRRRAQETPDEAVQRRAKHREESRAYYQRHIERLRPLRVAQATRYWRNNRAKVYAGRERRELAKRQWIADYKASRGCARCPERDPVCLDCHHPNGKAAEDRWIGRTSGWSLARIQRAIAKCEVICSNCHRKHHAAEQSGMWRKKAKRGP